MDLNDPGERLLATVKLRGSLDGSADLWWYRGNQYAIVDREQFLLWQVEGAQLGKYVKREDGSWDHVFRDVMFYLHPETSELLTEFENPYTGEMNKPPVMRMGPFTTNHSVTGATVQLPPNMPPGAMEVRWHYEPTVVQSNQVFIRETGTTRIANPAKDSGQPGASTKDFFLINDFFTLVGNVEDIVNDEVLSAPAVTNYASLNEWTPWLAMGDREGAVLGRGNSVKLASFDDLPPALTSLIEKEEASFFEDPEFKVWERSFHPLNQ